MRESALIVSKTLGEVAKAIQPGVSTLELDKIAETFIRDHGAEPGFLGLYDFPNTLCMSPNEQIVHGIPNKDPLQEGDIISVDCGALKNGFYGDHAYTFAVGEIDPETEKLLQVTKESLYIGIREFRVGNRVGDVGHAIQQYTESHGFGVVRELVGHGIGMEMHEDPEMPNYGRRGRGKKFVEGMVVAIEPMINLGTHRIKQYPDGWTIKTVDMKPSAHFEHDVAIVDGKPELLSTFQYIYEALGIVSDEEDEFRASS
jgi:methionyl aminopeptidase